MKTALIVVDIQNDYIKENGKLHIPFSKSIIKKINNIKNNFDLVCYTKNIFPIEKQYNNSNSITISDSGSYCVLGTDGSKIYNDLKINNNIFIRNYDKGYSVLTSVNNKNITLIDYLKNNDITHVFISGLPGDYSIKYSLLDLNKHFKTYMIIDLIRTLGQLEKLIKFLLMKKINLISSLDITNFLEKLNTDKKYYLNVNNKIKKSYYTGKWEF
jgi:nicotinamidase/pyrazinamidase